MSLMACGVSGKMSATIGKGAVDIIGEIDDVIDVVEAW
jgi:hypothetical protein